MTEMGVDILIRQIKTAKSGYLTQAQVMALVGEIDRLKVLETEVERLKAIVESPDPEFFFSACVKEAKFQRVKWPGPQGFDPSAFGNSSDQDYIFLAAYLCGGAAKTPDSDRKKKLHRITAAAAALANWHQEVRNRDE